MVSIHADQVINFLQLVSHHDEVGENKYELSLLTATAGSGVTTQKESDKQNSQLSKVCMVSAPVWVSIRCSPFCLGGTTYWIF